MGFNFGDTTNMRTTAEIGMREDNVAMAGGGLATLSDALMTDWMMESKAATLDKYAQGKEKRSATRADAVADKASDRATALAKEKGVLADAASRSDVYKDAEGKGIKKDDLKAMQTQWKEEVGNLPAIEEETIKIESHYDQLIDDVDVDGIDFLNSDAVKKEEDRLTKEKEEALKELEDSRSFDRYKDIKLGGTTTASTGVPIKANTKSRLEELRAKAGK